MWPGRVPAAAWGLGSGLGLLTVVLAQPLKSDIRPTVIKNFDVDFLNCISLPYLITDKNLNLKN